MLTFEEYLIEQTLNADDARAVLGLSVGFSPDELKVAYRKAAKRHHPDSGGSTADMARINAAYSKLKAFSPQPVVTPSTTDAEITATENDLDQEFRQMRAARRAELLSKNKK